MSLSREKPLRALCLCVKCLTLLLIITLASGAHTQDKPKLIGEIEFFGLSANDPNNIRAALPFHERDEFSSEKFGAQIEQAAATIKQLTGHSPTDLNATCCDDQGNWIVFIGLSGKTFRYHDPPQGKVGLPEKILELYDRFMESNMKDVQQGAGAEDRSQGYALSASPPLRAIQLEMRAYAVDHAALVLQVLATAADDRQRIAAAQLLGYTRQSQAQLAALVSAHRDANPTVRNNATRALLVLAASSPRVASRIPVADFIEQLLSGTWTDLNKASGLIYSIISHEHAKIPVALRRPEVRERLAEMAAWRTGHGQAAREILRRLWEQKQQR